MERITNALPFGGARNTRVPITSVLSYIFDYVIIIALAIAYAALDKLVTPFNQHFSIHDITISYPFAVKERIPILEAIIISAAFPAGVIALYTLIIDGLFSHHKVRGKSVYTFRDRLWELNCGILGLFLAQGAAFCITGTLKNLVGRPRPDLLSRCRPPIDAIDPPLGLSSSLICTQQDAHIMQDGFRSFPSGHSSSAFAGLFFLSLYLSGKLHVFDQRGEVWRTVIVIVPTAAAACIAASRIMDSRHHAFDVLFGSALGILCGWGAYRQYFPPLSHSWQKGRAYPMREWGVPMRGPNDRFAGYSGGGVDRAGEILTETDIEDRRYEPQRYSPRQTGQQTYSMEPIRARNMGGPTSEGFENVSVTEDMDYEHVRPKGVSGTPPVVMQRTGTGNAFRDHMATVESNRRNPASPDEDDLGYRRPLNMPGKA